MSKKAKTAKSKPRFRINYPLVIGVATLAVIVFWIFYPTYRMRMEQARELAAIKRELKRIKKQNEDLRFRIQELKKPEYIERYAREKMGLVKPGEKAFVVLPMGRSKPATRAPAVVRPKAESTETTGTWQRITSFFSELFGR